jgi:predicted metal-binding membrane protein
MIASPRVTVPRSLRVPAALVALALGGWVVSAVLMGRMTMMDSPGALGPFLWLWVAMSAAMMLPSVVPAASLAGRFDRSGTIFVAGYAAVWAATGVVAYLAARVLADEGQWLAAAAVVLAAAYQLTPLKAACLHRCRSPLGMLLRRSTFRAGLEQGLACLGCCWALMLALLALGIGSMFWMAALAAAIFAEKVTRAGPRASLPVAAVLAGAAVWIVL